MTQFFDHIRFDRLSLNSMARHAAETMLSVFAILFIGSQMPDANAASRIKDIADFEGVRENMLVGYGLVVGLNGTGDSLSNAAFTKQSLIGMLERLGVNTRDDTLNTKNVAAVIVTASVASHRFAGRKRRRVLAISAPMRISPSGSRKQNGA